MACPPCISFWAVSSDMQLKYWLFQCVWQGVIHHVRQRSRILKYDPADAVRKSNSWWGSNLCHEYVDSCHLRQPVLHRSTGSRQQRFGCFAGKLHHHARRRICVHVCILACDVVGFDIYNFKNMSRVLAFRAMLRWLR